MLLQSRRCVVALLINLIPLIAARGAGILDHVPADAMGFAVVRNMAAADAKVQQVAQIFAEVSPVAPPALLALVKAFGLGDGLDENGDVMLVLLPGDEGPAKPKPLVFVSVSDFGKFAASINGDASGEISRVTIAGEDVLLAKRGDYAVLMNVEHRPTMESLLLADANFQPAFADLTGWIAKNDAAIILLPAGVEVLTQMGQANLQPGMEIFDKMFIHIREDVTAAAVGVAIDDATNVRLSKRIVFKPGSKLASLPNIPKMESSPLAGVPAEPFVVAGGGPIPRQWVDFAAALSRGFMENFSEVYGFQDFDEEQWKKLEDSWKQAAMIRSYSAIMLAGAEGEPLYSGILGVMKVDDVAAYMDAARESIETWNELTEQSTGDIKMKQEVTEVELAGKKALKVTADVAAAAGDENVPMVKPMFEAMFGGDGKMNMYWIGADDETMLMAIDDEAGAAKAVEWLANGEQGLAQSAEVTTTTDLLDQAAPWTFYISPQGCVIWFERIMKTMMAQLGGIQMTIPAYPPGPPVGFSANLTGGQLHAEMAVPAQTLRDLAAYIKTCMQL